MDSVFRITERKPAPNVRLAIALSEEHPGVRHIGLLHRHQKEGSWRMLELARHSYIRDSLPDESDLWIVPHMGPRRQIQLAAFCRRIWTANRKSGVPYAFSAPSDCFDRKTGTWKPAAGQHGLTCATFVLAVFHSAGVPIVIYNSWPTNRAGDAEWQESIQRVQLIQWRASEEHLQSVRGEIGTARYRPEEVAGATTEAVWPVSFARAEELGKLLLQRLADGPPLPDSENGQPCPTS